MSKSRLLVVALAVAALAAAVIPLAHAANVHFTSTPTATRNGNELTVSFKVAGLGDNEAINYAVTANAQCFNRGSNAPRAENKGAVLASGTLVSDKNGNLVASVSGSAQTNPSCDPPMQLRYDQVTLTVDGISYVFPDTF